MNATFPVNWRPVFKSVWIYTSCAIIGGLLIPIGIATVSGRAPKHAIPFTSMVGYVLVFAPLFSAAAAFLVSRWVRLSSIAVSEGTVLGRSYWGRKNKIPLNDITKLTQFSSNGIGAIVVHSKCHGKIYISDRTERLTELLALLEPYANQRANPCSERPS